MGILKEFKEFALRGDVMDMAVGIIIGAAFSTIVRSLIDDIIMPLIGSSPAVSTSAASSSRSRRAL